MTLQDLLQDKKFKKSLEIFIQINSSHSKDIAEQIKLDIFKHYNLTEQSFSTYLNRYIQKYIETEKYSKS